jgi:phage baseplate assembly protein gpV
VTASTVTITPLVSVNGQQLTAQFLDSVTYLKVERALGLVGRVTLRFADVGYALSVTNTFDLGNDVVVTDMAGETLIEATVTGVSLEQSVNGTPELTVVADDVAYKLARGTKVTTYLDASYTDVISKMAQGSSLQEDVTASSAVQEYLLQTGTDLAFLNSIVERIGYVWWIDGKKLNAKPAGTSTGSVALALGDELIEFTVRASGLRPTSVTVTGWDRSQQQNITESQDTTSSASDIPAFVTKYTGSTSGTVGDAKASVADWYPADAAEATTIATALSSEWSAGAVSARGTCFVDGKVKPSVTVSITQAGPASGSYLVTEVEHVYSRAGFFTRFSAGPIRSTGLVDTLGAPAPDAGFAMPGLVVATVTNVNDPDSAGRAKVTYTGVDGSVESPWARIVTLGAGAKRGVVFQPEVGDEVLVGFERGDTRRPVVLGGLFSAKNALPTTNVADDKVNYRRITSRLGHVVELADGTGDDTKHVLIKLGEDGYRMRLGADRFDLELPSGKPLSIKSGDAKFEISSSGDITIQGNNISIKANGTLGLQSQSEATLKGTAKTSVQGAQVQVQADATVSVQGTAQVAIKGAMVAIN